MSDTLEPADLLDENGNVDMNSIRAIKNRKNTPADVVMPETCAKWRREADGAPNCKAVAEEVGRAEPTVYRHISGNCSCIHDTAPLEFDRSHQEGISGSKGKWRPADE